MKAIKINGKDFTENELKERKHCDTCNDGKIFLQEHIRKYEFGSKTKEYVCDECLTKYVFDRTDADILIGKECQLCDNKVYKENLNYLCICNRADMLIRLCDELSEGMTTMEWNEETLNRRYEFEKTGVCKNHIMIESKPVRTSEGEFIFSSCVICKQGSVIYKGKKIEGNLMKLVNYVANGGANKEKEVKETELDFSHIGKIKNDNNINTDNLLNFNFKDDEKTDNKINIKIDKDSNELEFDF